MYYLIAIVIFVVLIRYIIFLFRKKYIIHKAGIIIITGASTGIGRHAAEHLAQNYQSYLILAGVRKESDAKNIKDVGLTNLQPLCIDVTIHESCVNAINEVKCLMEKTSLPLIALVNNAGLAEYGPIEYYKMENIRSSFDINFFGVIDLIQLCLPLLRVSKGRIINISSMSAILPRPIYSIYSAAKCALETLSHACRREFALFDISVSIIRPAAVKTSMVNKISAAYKEGIPCHLTKSIYDDEFQGLYSKYYSEQAMVKRNKLLEAEDGPIVTSVAIEDAIVSATPKTLYAVSKANGISASLLGWLVWALPDRIKDALIANAA